MPKLTLNKRYLKTALIALSIVSLLLVLLSAYAYFVYKPDDVVVTNITDRSATVTWVTDKPTSGSVIVKEGGFISPVTISLFAKDKFYDDRDVAKAILEKSKEISEKFSRSIDSKDLAEDIKVEKVGKYYVHHVTVKDLDPEKEYSFKINNGLFYSAKSWTDSESSFTTFKELETMTTPDPAYGVVAQRTDREYFFDNSKDAIVYLNTYGDKGRTNTLSAVVNEQGGFYFDLTNAIFNDGFRIDTSDESSYHKLKIVSTPDFKSAELVATVAKDAPFETVVLEKADDSEASRSSKTLSSLAFTANAATSAPLCSDGSAGTTFGEACSNGCEREVRDCGNGDFKRGPCDHNCPSGGTTGEQPEETPEEPETPAGGQCPGGKNPGDSCRTEYEDNRDGMNLICTAVGTYNDDCTCSWGPGSSCRNTEPLPEGEQCILNGEPHNSCSGGACAPACAPGYSCTGGNGDTSCCTGSCVERPQEAPNPQPGNTGNGSTNGGNSGSGNGSTTPGNNSCGHTCDAGDNCDVGETCGTCDTNNCSCPTEADGTVRPGETCTSGNGPANNTCSNPIVRTVADGTVNCAGNEVRCVDGGLAACECKDGFVIRDGACVSPTTTAPAPTGVNVGASCVYRSDDPELVSAGCLYCASNGTWALNASGELCRSTPPTSTPASQCSTAQLNACKGNRPDPSIPDSSLTCAPQSNGTANCAWSYGNAFDGDTCTESSCYCNSNQQFIGQGKLCTSYQADIESLNGGEKCTQPSCYCLPNEKLLTDGQWCQERKESNNGDCDLFSTVDPWECASAAFFGGGCETEDDLGKVCNTEGRTCARANNPDNKAYYCTGPVKTSNRKENSNFNISLVSKAQALVSNPQISAQNGKFDIKEPGLYCGEYNGDKHCYLVKEAGEKNLFIDTNGNRVLDSGEVELSQVNGLSLSREVATQRYSIKDGFNLVSFNLVNESIATGKDLLGYLSQKYPNMFYSLSSFESGRWEILGVRDGEAYGVDNFSLIPGKGYLLKAVEDVDIEITGNAVTTPVPVTFSPGWNLIAVHGTSTQYTAESLIDSVDGTELIDADNVTRWDSSSAKYEGLQKEVDEDGLNRVFGFDFPLVRDAGYFVRVVEGQGEWQPE